MKVTVSSNLHLSSSLQNYVEDKIKENFGKIFDENSNVNVSFTKNGKSIKALIVLKEAQKRGLVVKSSAEADDAYGAFDLAIIKISREVRKHKEKLNSYKKKITVLKAQNSDLPYIIAERNIININSKLETESNEETIENFTVVETKKTEIEELTIDEALMKMDLLNLSGFAFVNKDCNKINFIYRRPDGNISWINPQI